MSALLTEPLLRMRPMEDGDMVAVLAVERAGYPHPWTEGNFRDCLSAGYCCWVLEQDGEIIGHGVLSVAVGEAHVLNVCIAPEQQGRGFGRMLLAHLLDRARALGAEMVFLEVRASNRPALELYESMGFNEIAVRRNYYPAPFGHEDAQVMALDMRSEFEAGAV